MQPSDHTLEAIRAAWIELRPKCKNDRSAIKKVTAYLNDKRLTRKRLKEITVSSYTRQLKLREPFKTRKTRVKANGLETSPVNPSLLDFETALKIIRQIDQLPQFCRKLILNHIKEEIQ